MRLQAGSRSLRARANRPAILVAAEIVQGGPPGQGRGARIGLTETLLAAALWRRRGDWAAVQSPVLVGAGRVHSRARAPKQGILCFGQRMRHALCVQLIGGLMDRPVEGISISVASVGQMMRLEVAPDELCPKLGDGEIRRRSALAC